MPLYGKPKGKGPGFDFDFSVEKLKKPVLVLLAVIVLFFVAQALLAFFSPKPTEFSFDRNPLNLAESQSSVLSITVKNVFDSTVESSVLSVEPVDLQNIIVFPAQKNIEILGKGEKRVFDFAIRPNPNGSVSSGDYKIRMSLEMNGKTFEEEATLSIKTA